MPIETYEYELKGLKLHTRSNFPMPLQIITLTLITYGDELIECRFSFRVNPKLYQYIDTEELFNLKPQLRGYLLAEAFLPESDFQIEVMLKPNLLFSLKKKSVTFELDFSDGEIRYKTSIDVDNDTLTSALIKQLVYANVTTMDEYLPGIMSVIDGNVEPKDAIAQIELT